MKNTKGITLVALVITIVLLLILGGVTVRTLTGQGSIIYNAENVVDKHNEKWKKEGQLLNDIEQIMFEDKEGN